MNLHLINLHTLKAAYFSTLTTLKGDRRLMRLIRRDNKPYLITFIARRMNQYHLKLVNESH